MTHVTGQLRRLEVASVIEATTLIVLVLVAVPLKYLWHVEAAVSVVGPIHGMAFAVYALLLLRTAGERGWPNDVARRLLLYACIPFAGFTTPSYIRRNGLA